MNDAISLAAAFGAGLFSFLSPCVLPVIPSYISFIGGISLEKNPAAASENKPAGKNSAGRFFYNGHVIAGTSFFILGFSSIFIALSVILANVIFLFRDFTRIVNIISGAVVILLGAHVLFNIFPFLNYGKQAGVKRPQNLAACFLVGLAFGSGWTPCISPLLTGVLFLAGQEGETARAVFLLAVYSLGLGLPFILAAVFFQFFLKNTAKYGHILPWIHRASGVLLVLLGLLILSGKMRAINTLLS